MASPMLLARLGLKGFPTSAAPGTSGKHHMKWLPSEGYLS